MVSLVVPAAQTLQPLVDDGLVEYHYSAAGAVSRGQAHDACMSEMKHRHAW
jgi:hypothetical protein